MSSINGHRNLVLKEEGVIWNGLADDGSNEDMNARMTGWHPGQALFSDKINITICTYVPDTGEKPYIKYSKSRSYYIPHHLT